MKFRKKPVVVEAMQFNGTNSAEVVAWSEMEWHHDDVAVAIKVRTLEGDLWANKGDWIIKGVKGEFYPCKPDIFEASYEPVKEGDAQFHAENVAPRAQIQRVFMEPDAAPSQDATGGSGADTVAGLPGCCANMIRAAKRETTEACVKIVEEGCHWCYRGTPDSGNCHREVAARIRAQAADLGEGEK